MDDPEIVENLAALDFSSSGPSMRRAIEALDLRLVRDILVNTNRDDKPLSADLAFDDAYGRNYTELITAAWKVGLYNRFFGPLDGFGALVQRAMAQAKGALSSEKQPTTE
jgi:hypothetical protein